MMLAGSIYQTENRKTANPTFTVGYTFTINLLERSRITDHYIT